MTASRKNGVKAARILFLCLGAAALFHGSPASAAWVDITPASNGLTLSINNTAVTFDLTAAATQLGNGIAIAGTPTVEFELVVLHTNNSPRTAPLTATAPAALVSGANLVPISDISWVSAPITGAPSGTTQIPGGSFVFGPLAILSMNIPGSGTFSAGGELTFKFANTTVYPPGNYGPATVTYTASMN
jgi:hypothetical protein